jgi:hypothetical protein
MCSVVGRHWSEVKKPKWRYDLQREPGEPALCRHPPPPRPSVDQCVLWQREMVEQLFILDDPDTANENIDASGEEQNQPAPIAPSHFPHDPRESQDEHPERHAANPSAHHARPRKRVHQHSLGCSNRYHAVLAFPTDGDPSNHRTRSTETITRNRLRNGRAHSRHDRQTCIYRQNICQANKRVKIIGTRAPEPRRQSRPRVGAKRNRGFLEGWAGFPPVRGRKSAVPAKGERLGH